MQGREIDLQAKDDCYKYNLLEAGEIKLVGMRARRIDSRMELAL